jgi:hypothetical protein
MDEQWSLTPYNQKGYHKLQSMHEQLAFSSAINVSSKPHIQTQALAQLLCVLALPLRIEVAEALFAALCRHIMASKLQQCML